MPQLNTNKFLIKLRPFKKTNAVNLCFKSQDNSIPKMY